MDVGNVVQANTTGLLSIQRLDPIYADFTVTEGDLPEVQRDGREGIAEDHGAHSVRSPKARRATGKLTFLDNAVQNATGTVNLRATIPNADHHFWPGQFVNVTLVLATSKGAVLIPNQATQISQQGPLRLRGEAGRYGGTAAGDAGAAAGRRRGGDEGRGRRRDAWW